MHDREKLIKGLECCLKESDHLYSNPCNGCPYEGQECIDQMKADALALLKEQETDIDNLNETVKNLLNAYTEIKAIYGDDSRVVGELVRCKDCKHRGEWERAEDIHGSYSYIVFPDGSLCPGQCEDSFYAWRPDDDWYCANGERRDPDA